jgi:hypothetical protein
MSTNSLRLIRSLCVLAALSGAANLAVAATPEKLAATTEASSQSVSMLDGKLPFVLKGYEARAIPGHSNSTMYFDSRTDQAIIVTEGPLPVVPDAKANNAFRIAVDTVKEKQHAASPNYRITNERTTRVKGLQVHHLEATDEVNGMPLLMATLTAIDRQKIAIIEVMSSVDDPTGHAAAVNNILSK